MAYGDPSTSVSAATQGRPQPALPGKRFRPAPSPKPGSLTDPRHWLLRIEEVTAITADKRAHAEPNPSPQPTAKEDEA